MSKLYRHICECANEHAAHGDRGGADAIMVGAHTSKAAALRRYPQHAAAIENAFAFAIQQTGANRIVFG